MARTESLPVVTGRVLPGALVAAAGAAYLWSLAFIGWIPHDEGALAQSAQRFLAGEIPHRDFTEIYTCGLTFLHAAAFRVFGESLVALRYPMLAAMVAGIIAIYLITSRFLKPWPSALLTAAAVLWSFPNYPASLPSWYNLVCALWGTVALLRYLDDPKPRWALLAGLAGGVSLLFKIIGVYFIVAAALALLLAVVWEQELEKSESRGARVWWIGLVLTLGVLAAAGPFVLMRASFGTFQAVVLTLPIEVGVVAVAAIAIAAARDRAPTIAASVRAFGPYLLGILIPVLLLVAAYAHWHAVSDLWRGVVVLPQRRVQAAAQAGASLWQLALALPLVALAVGLRNKPRGLWRWVSGILVASLVIAVGLAWLNPFLFDELWTWARMCAVPVLVTGFVVAAWRARTSNFQLSLPLQRLIVILLVAAWFSLIQFPFAGTIYFAYSMPFVLIGAAALLVTSDSSSTAVRVALLAAAFFVGARSRQIVFRRGLPDVVVENGPTGVLPPPGGLRVLDAESAIYSRVVALIAEHSSSDVILAGPDAPEVYFLSGRKNPTRMIFDFLDDQSTQVEQALAVAAKHRVEVVVINHSLQFSKAYSPDVLAAIDARFPHREAVGQFEVRW